MPVTEATPFDCPNCGAQYKLVRVETNETLPDQQLACRKCGGPLQGRQGRFVLKYFLVDRPVEGLLGGGEVIRLLRQTDTYQQSALGGTLVAIPLSRDHRKPPCPTSAHFFWQL